MRIKNAILSLSIIVILTICMFNSVAAAPVSRQTTDVHSNYVADVRGQQQTYILATLDDKTTATTGVGQSVSLGGVLSYGKPPTSSIDSSHGIPDATLNIQSLNPDGRTWRTVATTITDHFTGNSPLGPLLPTVGWFAVKLTPEAAGVYIYRVTYDGDSQYTPAVSGAVTLTVTNVAIS